MSDVTVTRIKIKLDENALKAVKKVRNDALVGTAKILQDVILEEGVIPRKDNHLAGEKFTVNVSEAKRGVVYLEHEGPYARRLYFHPEYNFHKSPWVDKDGKEHLGNRNAMANWFSWWEEGGRYQKQVAGIYAEELKRRL